MKNIGKQTENLASGAKDKYIGSVRFFKNMILLAVLIAIAVPTAMACVLEQRLDEVNATMEQLRAEKHIWKRSKHSSMSRRRYLPERS